MPVWTMCVRLLHLPLLAMGAWIVAGTLSFWIAQGARALPEPGVPGRLHSDLPSLRDSRAEGNEVIVRLNLFGSALSREAPPGDPASPEEVHPVVCSLPLSLVGTVVATEPWWTFALITNLPRNETGLYRVADRLGEATVISIQGQRVVLRHEGRLEILELRPEGTAAGTPGDSAPAPSITSGLRREGNRVQVDRSLMDRLLTDPGPLLSDVRILPVFKEGGGLKVYSMRPGSLLSEAGLRNGDVLTRVDGFPLDSPDRMLEILQRLRSATEVNLELSRQGQTHKLTFQIR